MKKGMLLLTSLLLLHTILPAQQTVRALFLGNSYTNYNNLPGIIGSLANANGDTLLHDWNVPGGSTLEGHSTNGGSLGLIQSPGPWDFLVLQEQSQRPSFSPFQVQQEVYPYAKILSDSLRSAHPCATPVFFMTWGRKNGDQNNCQFYPPVCTYEGMQGRLRASYMEMSVLNAGYVSPVGSAWWRSRILDPQLDLYTGDGSHPNYAGSYLAACVFYATLFQKSPAGIPFYGTLDSTTATFFQNIAHTVVLDSFPQWDATVAPVAGFGFQAFQDSVVFTDSSAQYTSLQWDFGDGTAASTAPNPSHVYATSGTYTVTLIASDGCRSDTATSSIEIVLVGQDAAIDHSLQLYPQPVSDYLRFRVRNPNGSPVAVEVYGRDMGLVRRAAFGGGAPTTTGTVDTHDLAAGIYFIRLRIDGQIYSRKITLL